MVGDFGQVYLMDWGLARLTQDAPGLRGARADGSAGPGRHAALHGARAGARQPGRHGRAQRRLRARRHALRDRQRPDPLRRRARPPTSCSTRAEAGQVVPIDERHARHRRRRKRIRAHRRQGDRSPTGGALPERRSSCSDDVRAFLRGGLHLPRKHLRARRGHHPRRRHGRRRLHDRQRALPRLPHASASGRRRSP